MGCFLKNIKNNKYEILAVLLIVILELLNFGWLSLKAIPETAPGYYENTVVEHTQRLINLRDEYQKQREDMRKELISRKHTYLETAQIALKLNISESRYLDFWLTESPIVIGMLKPFEESKYQRWYVNLPPENRDVMNSVADNLHHVYPILAECNKNAGRDYQELFLGLSEPSKENLADTLVAQTRVIIRNISQSENSPSEICDNAMMSYFSSVQTLSRTYRELADAYQNYADDNEKFRKVVNSIVTLN